MTYEGKVILFTSFYSQLAFAPYVKSLMDTVAAFTELGVKWEYWCNYSDFHIDTCVNDALTRAANTEGVTDIIMLDSDQSWGAKDIVRLLLVPAQVVAGSYRTKNNWSRYTGQIEMDDGMPVGRMMSDGKPILKALKVSGGFLRINTEVLRKYAAAYPEARSLSREGETVVYFERSRTGNVVLDQDMAFSARLAAMGVDMWIDPTLEVSHWGFIEHKGNFDKHLKGEDGIDWTAKGEA